MRRWLLSLAAACLAMVLALRHREEVSPPIAKPSPSNESQPPSSTFAASTRVFTGFVVDEKGRAIAGATGVLTVGS